MKDTTILTSYVLDEKQLMDYGFKKDKNKYVYEKEISFSLKVRVTITKKIFIVDVFDVTSNEKYVPFYLNDVAGAYTAKMKENIEKLQIDILEKCFINENLRDKVLSYVWNAYGTVPVYPWDSTPDACPLKKNNGKWYALLMDVSCTCLKINKEGKVTILNVKLEPEKIEQLVDYQHFFPAYHMNKKYWMTILLSCDVDMQLVQKLIDESYQLVK